MNTQISQVVRATVGCPMIQWLSDDGETFSFDGDILSHTRLKKMVCGVVEALETSFRELLEIGGITSGKIPHHEHLYYSLTNTQEGYSVFTDPRNDFTKARQGRSFSRDWL